MRNREGELNFDIGPRARKWVVRALIGSGVLTEGCVHRVMVTPEATLKGPQELSQKELRSYTENLTILANAKQRGDLITAIKTAAESGDYKTLYALAGVLLAQQGKGDIDVYISEREGGSAGGKDETGAEYLERGGLQKTIRETEEAVLKLQGGKN